MQGRRLALVSAAVSASATLAVGVIGGAFASGGGGGASGSAGATASPVHLGGGGHGGGGHRGGPPFGARGPRLDADARAVLEDVREALADRIPGIARPVLDRAVSGNDIDRAQADRLADLVGRERLSADAARALFADPAAAAVLFDVRAAVARAVPGIVRPIVDRAVAAGDLTEAQADRIVAAAAWGHGHGGGPRGGFRRP